jgi:hypothetical protein
MSPRLSRRNYGRGHGYKLDGHKVPGVTTILNALPKPALTKWAAECGADVVLNDWDTLAGMKPSERHDAVLWAHKRVVKSAATRGTRIHSLADKLAHGEEVEVPDDIRGPVEAYARFLDAWQIETFATETPIASTRYRYGGTADLWGKVGRLGVTALLDVKTGKGVYAETSLQLAGYRYADLWQPDGPESEAALPAVDECYVIHVRPDSVELLPLDVDETLFRGFLYVAEVAKLLDRLKDESPVGSALTLEDYL